jgi:hypothetical protein
MRGVLNAIWVVLVLGVLVLLGQSFGLYDVPLLHDFRIALPVGLPIGPTPLAAVEPTPSPPPATVAPSPRPASPVPSVAPSGTCTATSLRFVQGAAALKAGVGASMGEPLECERGVDEAGDTEQRTTTGLAYYRARSNIAAFTNGFDHWALMPTGVVHWTGDDVEPPADEEPAQPSE